MYDLGEIINLKIILVVNCKTQNCLELCGDQRKIPKPILYKQIVKI
jgi:hypothetical protein